MAQQGIKSKFDSVVVGAGIMGLWAALHLVREGRSVCIIEEKSVGAGASGGFVGALLPHVPDGWNAKKAFQYQALIELESQIDSLTSQYGISSDYRRCGRLMPLPQADMGGGVDRRCAGADKHWDKKYSFKELDAYEGIRAPHGVTLDTFSARVHPQKLLALLERALQGQVTWRIGTGVTQLDAANKLVHLADGTRVFGDEIIVANGWQAYDLLQPYLGAFNHGKSIGRGVKGQAVLLEYDHDDDWPVIYADGAYIVPHANNLVAIGSTSTREWEDETSFDDDNMDFYRKALNMMPALEGAKIIAKWASVRPRNTIDGRGTSPWFGPVPGHPNLIALIGGFKISFGIAHMAMRVARGELSDPA